MFLTVYIHECLFMKLSLHADPNASIVYKNLFHFPKN